MNIRFSVEDRESTDGRAESSVDGSTEPAEKWQGAPKEKSNQIQTSSNNIHQPADSGAGEPDLTRSDSSTKKIERSPASSTNQPNNPDKDEATIRMVKSSRKFSAGSKPGQPQLSKPMEAAKLKTSSMGREGQADPLERDTLEWSRKS